MKGSKFLLSAVAAKLVAAYTQCIAEYRTIMPLVGRSGGVELMQGYGRF
nr:MAG TPA: hypothetical protein [Caudoviricetes sp.]